jgi:hypothetical protein
MTLAKRKLTPPELGRLWGCDPEKIRRWIEAGELRAINAAENLGGRPRYLIDLDDITAFEHKRAVVEPPKVTPKRQSIVKPKKRYF